MIEAMPGPRVLRVVVRENDDKNSLAPAPAGNLGKSQRVPGVQSFSRVEAPLSSTVSDPTA